MPCPVGISHEATLACREPTMRRYLRCPGVICCPARRALQEVLQPCIRFCDELIAVALSPLPRGCGASAHQLPAPKSSPGAPTGGPPARPATLKMWL
eukprot:jgi/Chrpa1/27489/Chrysochromulina_OHIO_Genome00026274-RA